MSRNVAGPERNDVYRAVENTAHGLISWTRQDCLVSGLVALVGGILHLIVGVLLFIASLLVILAGRRAWSGRRDYLTLLVRRFHTCRYQRLLDPDTQYSPYAVQDVDVRRRPQ